MAIKLKLKIASESETPAVTKSYAAEVGGKTYDLKGLIDLSGANAAQAKALQVKATGFSDTAKEANEAIMTYVDTLGLPADEKKSLVGKSFMANVGAMGEKRSVSDKEEIYKMLGHEQFMEICDLPLGKLDDYLTLAQRTKVISVEPTKRSLTIKAM